MSFNYLKIEIILANLASDVICQANKPATHSVCLFAVAIADPIGRANSD